jgi:hypothetical protein
VEIFAFRVDVFAGPPIDLTDFDVESSDGEHIGKVDEATYENGVGWLVVDTGHWIFGKRRMLPAGVVTSVEPETTKVVVSMTKDQVKDAPDYDHDRHVNDRVDYHEDVGSYYHPYGVHGAGSASLHEAEAANFTEPGAERFL